MRSSIKTATITACFCCCVVFSNARFTGLSEMRDVIEQYRSDAASLTHKYEVKESEEYYTRFGRFHADWLEHLRSLPFDDMSQDGKVDYVLLRNRIEKHPAAILPHTVLGGGKCCLLGDGVVGQELSENS